MVYIINIQIQMWGRSIEQQKSQLLVAGLIVLIDKSNYINLLILKPFKAGVTE